MQMPIHQKVVPSAVFTKSCRDKETQKGRTLYCDIQPPNTDKRNSLWWGKIKTSKDMSSNQFWGQMHSRWFLNGNLWIKTQRLKMRWLWKVEKWKTCLWTWEAIRQTELHSRVRLSEPMLLAPTEHSLMHPWAEEQVGVRVAILGGSVSWRCWVNAVNCLPAQVTKFKS